MAEIDNTIALQGKVAPPPDVVGQITSLAQLQYMAARGQEAQAQAALTGQNVQRGAIGLNALQDYNSRIANGEQPEGALIHSGLGATDPAGSTAILGNVQSGMTIAGNRAYAANPNNPMSAAPAGPALVGTAATAAKTMADTTTANLQNTGRIGLSQNPTSLSAAGLEGGAAGVGAVAGATKTAVATQADIATQKAQIASELLGGIVTDPDGTQTLPPEVRSDLIQRFKAVRAASGQPMDAATEQYLWQAPVSSLVPLAKGMQQGGIAPTDTPTVAGAKTAATTRAETLNKPLVTEPQQTVRLPPGLSDTPAGGAPFAASPFNGLPSGPLSPPPGAPPANSQGLPAAPVAPGRVLGPPGLQAASAPLPVGSAGGPTARAADGTPVATDARGNAIDPKTGLTTTGAAPIPASANSFAPAVPGTIRNANEVPQNMIGPAAPSAGGTAGATKAQVLADNAQGAQTIAQRETAGGTAGVTPQNIGQRIYTGLIQRGFTPVQAAALTGNMKQESEFNPAAPNPTEGGIGLLQWRLDRRNALNAFAAARGASPTDLNTQLDFVKYEMGGPESASAAPFLKATDLASANQALHGYIRYGNNSEPTRLAYAESIANGKFPVGNLVAPPPSAGAPGARPAIFGSNQGVGTTAQAANIPVPPIPVAPARGTSPLAPVAPAQGTVAPIVPSPTNIAPAAGPPGQAPVVQPVAANAPAPVAAPVAPPGVSPAAPAASAAAGNAPLGWTTLQPGMTIAQKEEQEGQGKAYGELPAQLDQAASSARTMNTTLDEVAQAAAGGTWTPGKWAPFAESAREGLQSVAKGLGISTPGLDQSIADYQDFVKMAGNVSRAAAHETSSRVGVQEMQLINKSLPSPEMSEGGIGLVIPQMKGLGDFTIAKQQAAAGWRAANNNSLGPMPQSEGRDFQAYWNENISPAAFVLHRMQLDNPTEAQTLVARMAAQPGGKDVLKSLAAQVKLAQTAGLLP
jgi:hypothetical protein